LRARVLGTRYVDYNGRLCMVSAAAGNNKAFGIDRAANPWDDIPLAEVLLIAGANCAETFPVLNKFLWQQRDNGGRWIIVDPRETPTARQGDLHLQLKPGTDVALANGMLNVIIGENWLMKRLSPRGRTIGKRRKRWRLVTRRRSLRR
jgi:assimilatory nitrate reductase catalytic subunit